MVSGQLAQPAGGKGVLSNMEGRMDLAQRKER